MKKTLGRCEGSRRNVGVVIYIQDQAIILYRIF